MRCCGVCVGLLFPGALSILKGAVPDLARGLDHMAPTYVVGSRDRCPTAHVARTIKRRDSNP